MNDLADFIRARLDEDEQTAQRVTPTAGAWSVGSRMGQMGSECCVWDVDRDQMAWPRSKGHAAHIARHDPARVLREVEAKRRIIELCAVEIDGGTDGACTAESVLYLLALPYADHEEFKDEWRP